MAKVKIRAPYPEFTPIDNSFIDNYLKDVRGDFIKVYLLCLRLGYSDKDITTEYIADSLNLLQTDVMKAFEYWENNGLMKLNTDGLIEILPIKNVILEEGNVSFDKTIKEMLNDIEGLIGRFLSSKEVSTYLNFIEDFNFTPEIITLLVEYCASRKKTDIRYIEKVALGWYDSGIRSLEDAQNYITKHEDKWNRYRAILNFIGMKDADIAKPQEEFLEKWLFKFNYSNDVILEACRICIIKLNEANFNYIDAILTNWYKSGVKILSDIKKIDKKPKVAKRTSSNYFNDYGGQRTYDIKELERQLLGRENIVEE